MRLESNKAPLECRNDRKPGENPCENQVDYVDPSINCDDIFVYIWLVVEKPSWRMMEFVNGKDDIPFYCGVPNHQSDTVKSSFSATIGSPSNSLSISIRKQTKIHSNIVMFKPKISQDFPTQNLPTSRHSDHFPEKSQHFAPQKFPVSVFRRHLQGAAEALNFFQEAVDLPKCPGDFPWIPRILDVSYGDFFGGYPLVN